MGAPPPYSSLFVNGSIIGLIVIPIIYIASVLILNKYKKKQLFEVQLWIMGITTVIGGVSLLLFTLYTFGDLMEVLLFLSSLFSLELEIVVFLGIIITQIIMRIFNKNIINWVLIASPLLLVLAVFLEYQGIMSIIFIISSIVQPIIASLWIIYRLVWNRSSSDII
ncbi:hypothetical protein KY362_06380 [Candidatus Woesearchaeota archaeon]|nr:hypothetical protein [Candidatus Woesearchaeota archaeon]